MLTKIFGSKYYEDKQGRSRPLVMKGSHLQARKAYSLVELLIILVIVVVLILLAIPSLLNLMRQYRVTSNAQALYFNLQYARSEALKRGQSVYISFQTGSSWCYGMNRGSACNCTNPSSCNLGSFTPTSSQLSLTLSGFSSPLIFQGSRGNANGTGTITLTAIGGTQSMGVDVSTVGNILLCSTTLSGYPTC